MPMFHWWESAQWIIVYYPLKPNDSDGEEEVLILQGWCIKNKSNMNEFGSQKQRGGGMQMVMEQ